MFSDIRIVEICGIARQHKALGQSVSDFQSSRFKLAECATKDLIAEKVFA
jgi:hypothetical protein